FDWLERGIGKIGKFSFPQRCIESLLKLLDSLWPITSAGCRLAGEWRNVAVFHPKCSEGTPLKPESVRFGLAGYQEQDDFLASSQHLARGKHIHRGRQMKAVHFN